MGSRGEANRFTLGSPGFRTTISIHGDVVEIERRLFGIGRVRLARAGDVLAMDRRRGALVLRLRGRSVRVEPAFSASRVDLEPVAAALRNWLAEHGGAPPPPIGSVRVGAGSGWKRATFRAGWPTLTASSTCGVFIALLLSVLVGEQTGRRDLAGEVFLALGLAALVGLPLLLRREYVSVDQDGATWGIGLAGLRIPLRRLPGPVRIEAVPPSRGSELRLEGANGQELRVGDRLWSSELEAIVARLDAAHPA